MFGAGVAVQLRSRSTGVGRLRAGAALVSGVALVLSVLLSGCGTDGSDSVAGNQGYVGASVSRPSSSAEVAGGQTPSTNVVPELVAMNVSRARLISVPSVAGQGEPDLAQTVGVERVYELNDAQAVGLRALETVGEVSLASGQYLGVVKDAGRKPVQLQIFGNGANTEIRVVLGAESEKFISTRCECDAVENPGLVERAWLVPLGLSAEQVSALVVK